MNGTRLELTELPEEWADLCRKLRPDLDPQKCFVRFHKYWTGQYGERGVMKDWRATWRNHVTNLKLYPLFPKEARPAIQTYQRTPTRTYSESKPLPEKHPESPAYREFQARLAKVREKRVEHPRFVPFGWVQVGDAIVNDQQQVDAARREWDEERLAMENQDKPVRT